MDQRLSCFSDAIKAGGLIPIWAKLNFAVLPIGDNFTRDATDAAECARIIAASPLSGFITTLSDSSKSTGKKGLCRNRCNPSFGTDRQYCYPVVNELHNQITVK